MSFRSGDTASEAFQELLLQTFELAGTLELAHGPCTGFTGIYYILGFRVQGFRGIYEILGFRVEVEDLMLRV